MKNFNEMLEMVQDENVMACRVSSGHSVAYEPAYFNGFTVKGNIKMVTKSGSKFQIKDECGVAVMVGKAKDLFIKSESKINDNYFESIVL